ncbi:MAG TPA: hypothetical protein VF214_03615 [Edaphobacter sp.]
MKAIGRTFLGLASLIFCGASAAHAAVGQLSCTSNSVTITANLSFYDLGLSNTSSIGSQSTGAGAGKVTFSPLEIHTAVINFQQFLQVAERGTAFSSCTLTTRTGGEAMEYKFSLVAISSLDAIARSPRDERDKPASYLDVKLMYGAVEVQTSTGTDDGGSEGSSTSGSGWNRVTNQTSGTVN